jgi:multiple sugar transport system permease protein
MRSRNALLVHFVAFGVGVLFLLPLYWAIVASLRETGLPPPVTVEWWPATPAWDNYRALFQTVPMWRYTLNSLVVVAGAVPITLVTAALAGFGMSQLLAPVRKKLILVSVVLLMIPSAAVWVFRFQILSWLGLLDSLWALIIPSFAASSPLFVLLYHWTFRRIPGELFDHAQLEGGNAWSALFRIALPMSVPTTIAVAILAFVLYWSDFVSPVLFIFDPKRYPLPIGLQILKQLDSTNFPLLMAGAVFMTIPVILLLFVLQRLFLQGNSLGNLFDRG